MTTFTNGSWTVAVGGGDQRFAAQAHAVDFAKAAALRSNQPAMLVWIDEAQAVLIPYAVVGARGQLVLLTKAQLQELGAPA